MNILLLSIFARFAFTADENLVPIETGDQEAGQEPTAVEKALSSAEEQWTHFMGNQRAEEHMEDFKQPTEESEDGSDYISTLTELDQQIQAKLKEIHDDKGHAINKLIQRYNRTRKPFVFRSLEETVDVTFYTNTEHLMKRFSRVFKDMTIGESITLAICISCLCGDLDKCLDDLGKKYIRNYSDDLKDMREFRERFVDKLFKDGMISDELEKDRLGDMADMWKMLVTEIRDMSKVTLDESTDTRCVIYQLANSAQNAWIELSIEDEIEYHNCFNETYKEIIKQIKDSHKKGEIWNGKDYLKTFQEHTDEEDQVDFSKEFWGAFFAHRTIEKQLSLQLAPLVHAREAKLEKEFQIRKLEI